MAKKKTGKAASKARRAAQKAKASSSSKSSSSSSSKSNSVSSSSKTTSSSARYETTDGRKFTDKSDATAHQRKLNDAGKGRGTKYDVNTTPTKEQEKKEMKEEEESIKYEKADDSELRSSAEFKALNKDDQEAVLAVFNAIASNDAKKANRLVQGFRAATKMNDPFFEEQLKLSIDAIERGYVEIDKEAEFKERQLANRLKDLKEDFESRKEYLSLEEATTLRGIEREYEMNLEDTRQSMAASGFTQSTRRAKKEDLLNEATGDLRQSTKRKFAFEIDNEAKSLSRSDRDTQNELRRLNEITKAGKLDFLRKAEQEVGSSNLPRLDADYKPLGDIYGDIPRKKLENTLAAATSFVF